MKARRLPAAAALSALALLLTLLQPPAAAAAEPDPCQTQNNTMEINACAKQQLDASDRELNRVYRGTLGQLRGGTSASADTTSPSARLVQAQRKWLEFRDADCKAQGALYEGGTLKTVIVLSCLREHNELRTKQLDPRHWQGG